MRTTRPMFKTGTLFDPGLQHRLPCPTTDSGYLPTKWRHMHDMKVGASPPSSRAVWLCCRVNPSMDEKEKLSHLMEGVAEDAFQFPIAKSPGTVANFSTTCKTFEDDRRSHLNKSAYHRPPNVPTPFTCPAANAPDTRTIVREVVREKLRGCASRAISSVL